MNIVIVLHDIEPLHEKKSWVFEIVCELPWIE